VAEEAFDLKSAAVCIVLYRNYNSKNSTVYYTAWLFSIYNPIYTLSWSYGYHIAPPT